MTIAPDEKDWTWVIEQPCVDCGFDAAAAGNDRIAALLRDQARQWRSILARPDVRRRPDDSTWSPLEYGCHVRDVFRLYEQRLHRMLDEHDPLFQNWDQDATAIEDRYDEQDPAAVADELAEAAERLALSFEAVGSRWDRTGSRSDGARFTVDTFSRYLVHDPIHHVWDVSR
jgi:hypothetical protein